MFRISPAIAFLSIITANAFAQDWQPYTGEENLRRLMSGSVLETTLAGEAKSVGRYSPDGSGVLEAWGESFPRTWSIKDGEQVCIQARQQSFCSSVEKAADQENLYRATNLSTGESVVFTILGGEEAIQIDSPLGEGGAAEPSADEVAKSLANPNTPLASQTFKFQYRTFDGDLPGADDESSSLVLYQPAFPFPLDNGATVFFRPAIPMIIEQPYFDAGESEFDSTSGLGDIGFDLAYGRTTQSGVLWAVGVVSTLPTATEDELGPDRWSLGPEFLIGKLSKKYVLGALTTYQTDIGGSGDADISLTTVNAFATWLPGGGWNLASAPIMSYDHENSQWTLPINLTVGKTVIWNGRPWKLSVEANYFVEQADAFGPEWMFGINVAPVVENVFARMLQ